MSCTNMFWNEEILHEFQLIDHTARCVPPEPHTIHSPMLGMRGPANARHTGTRSTGTRITVRELIDLHRRRTVSQEVYKRKRTFPQIRSAQPNLPEWKPAWRPLNPACDIAAGGWQLSPAPATGAGDVSPCQGVPSVCQPYVRGSPPQRGPDRPAVLAGEDMSLFQWQILQQRGRLGEVAADTLRLQDEDGDTCLHIAVAQGKRALAYVLAERDGGSIDAKEHNGQSALHIAAVTNQHLIVEDLLLLGSKLNSRDHWGRTPLHVCAEKGHVLTLQSIHKTLPLLNCQPIDVDLFNFDGLSPLHVAVTSYNRLVSQLRALSKECSLIAMELARRKRQYVDCVRTLLQMGARASTKDLKNGKTSLHIASEEATDELFHIILNHPSSSSVVNAVTYSGNTALHIVSSLVHDEDSLKALMALLNKGADTSARNLENDQPVHLLPNSPIGDTVRKIIKGKKHCAIYLTVPKMQKRCQSDSSKFN